MTFLWNRFQKTNQRNEKKQKCSCVCCYCCCHLLLLLLIFSDCISATLFFCALLLCSCRCFVIPLTCNVPNVVSGCRVVLACVLALTCVVIDSMCFCHVPCGTIKSFHTVAAAIVSSFA